MKNCVFHNAHINSVILDFTQLLIWYCCIQTAPPNVLLAVKTLKAGKAAGYDEIRPEMPKTLNQGGLWLTHVCQMV